MRMLVAVGACASYIGDIIKGVFRWKTAQWLLPAAYIVAVADAVEAPPPSLVQVSVKDRVDGVHNLFLISVLPNLAIRPAGMAVDTVGNIYFSDNGSSTNDGRIMMLSLEGDIDPISIANDIGCPSDIEISPDGRSIVVACPDGKVITRYFGLSIQLLFAKGQDTPKQPDVFVKTDTGTFHATVSGDGYFHFPELLQPQQTNDFVSIIVLNGNRLYVLEDKKLQSAGGRLEGETVLNITLPP